MGPGFKYHVVTIVGIFLALTVGLVVGGLYVSPRSLNQSKRAIDALRARLDKDDTQKTADLNATKQCLATVLPTLLANRLNGSRVAIIQAGDYGDVTPRVREALTLSGVGSIVSLTIARAFAQPDTLLQANLETLHATDPRFPTDRDGIADLLASLLAHGDDPETALMPDLERAEFVRAESDSDFTLPIKSVVLVGGTRLADSNRTALVDVPLIAALQKAGISVVACEPQDAAFSDIPAYTSLMPHIATVDNVDSDIGRIALIYALAGDRDNFGVKPSANSLLPVSAGHAP